MIKRTFDIQDVERINRTMYLFEAGNEAEITFHDQQGRTRSERYFRVSGHQFRMAWARRPQRSSQ